MSNILTINVLDIPLFDGDITELFNLMKKDISAGVKMNKQISLCDANVLVTSKRNRKFQKLLQYETYLNLADGIPGVWVGKLKGAKKIDRCYGPDVLEYVMKNSSNEGYNHFFTGGKEGVAKKLKQFCSGEFKNNNIVGTHCPPFREMPEQEIIEIAKEINHGKADIVWIGISSPKQDIYAHRLKKYLNVHFIFTVGAAFDFYTGNVKQAPRFIQRSGFEWLFRLLMEPKRLWKRYFSVIPLFIYYNLKGIYKTS